MAQQATPMPLLRDASRPLAQPASVAPVDPPSTHKDGLVANPIREGAARPLRRCKKEGNGRRRRVGIKGALRARPHATRIMHENTPFEHFRSSAPRYEGWHTIRACFFTPKIC
jgi:hypothetical protein